MIDGLIDWWIDGLMDFFKKLIEDFWNEKKNKFWWFVFAICSNKSKFFWHHQSELMKREWMNE
jgi:hypothetical protein